jgi:hypothetical protein
MRSARGRLVLFDFGNLACPQHACARPHDELPGIGLSEIISGRNDGGTPRRSRWPQWHRTAVLSGVCVTKTQIRTIWGAARRRRYALRCARSAEPVAKPAHPCSMSGAFSPRCNSSRKILGVGANAARPMRRRDRRTRDGSFRLASLVLLVKTGKAQIEHMFSGLPPTTDIRQHLARRFRARTGPPIG